MFLERVTVRPTGLALLAFAAITLEAPAADKPVDYGRDVRPILSENCFHCHGQDAKKRMAGLRLDTFEGATTKRGGRTALAPGQLQASGIHERITTGNVARRMPPASSNRRLTAEQIHILNRWIEEGGKYSKHWAFEPPRRPAIPAVSTDRWVRQPLDAFVLDRLRQEKLEPNGPATPDVWLRRVSLDLTGLPPTPMELTAFSRDVKRTGETAYAQAVDRLLASPHYGERMAIDWLDVARYADTHGFNNDSARSMWRWRDWVLDSFNSNMPYDRFITEQLAGDLLPNPSLGQQIATGFGRNHVINSEGGIIDEEYRIEYVADRVRTLGMAWLGLTVECARCHDHKYDPISQRDHYRFFAFFNNVAEWGEDGRVANAAPTIAAPTKAQQERLRSLESQIATAARKMDRIERRWKWEKSNHLLAAKIAGDNPVAGAAALKIPCENAAGFAEATTASLALAPGLRGQACAFGPAPNDSRLSTEAVPISKRQPFTFSAWILPSNGDHDAALFSSADYATSQAGTGFGKGLELRLVKGEVEFRFADRYPAYAIRVRSKDAAITPGQWRHVVLVYAGAPDAEAQRAEASWVRIFVDSRELETAVFNDGLGVPTAKNDKPSMTKFRVGWDNGSGSARYGGLLDEAAIWSRPLQDAEITILFESHAIPYAAGRQREGRASPVETEWLRRVSLINSNREYVKQQQDWQAARSERLELIRQAPTVMVMKELTAPRDTRILLRGAYNAPGDSVEPGVPEDLLGAWPAGAPRNRLGLAKWLTKPDHPLTARVVVNRFWQQLFGTGLVKTSDNFGLQGEWPSHPDLLDWLAREFVDSGWNVKALLKQIVLSSTYRQDSGGSKQSFERDPENRLLARGPRVRLPAEVIRDQALFVSGLLTDRLGGPSVFPYQPKDLYKGIVVAADYPGTSYTDSKGQDQYRRSLYTFWKRTVPHPTMTVFDAPDREFCIVRRSNTNTPLQALTLLNDPIFVEAARKLAERSVREGGSSAESRLEFAFKVATGRTPKEPERRVLRTKLDEMLAAFSSDEEGARSLVAVGSSPVETSIPVRELAAYVAVANMILNMDEVITKG